MQKLYCYVDESGQDTKGEFFLVSIIITEKEFKDKIEHILFNIERETGKRKTKWRPTPLKRKIKYLENVLCVNELKGSIFYDIYKNNQEEYIKLTGESVAMAIKIKAEKNYSSTILIDGLNPAEQRKVVKIFRARRIHYKKVKGVRDQSNSIIRLADAMAGFIRDYKEGKIYAKKIFVRFRNRGFVKEI